MDSNFSAFSFARAGRSAFGQLLCALAHPRFDLDILDFAMPEMYGLQLAAAIRSEKKTESMPLILLTSYVERKYRELAMTGGFSRGGIRAAA